MSDRQDFVIYTGLLGLCVAIILAAASDDASAACLLKAAVYGAAVAVPLLAFRVVVIGYAKIDQHDKVMEWMGWFGILISSSAFLLVLAQISRTAAVVAILVALGCYSLVIARRRDT